MFSFAIKLLTTLVGWGRNGNWVVIAKARRWSQTHSQPQSSNMLFLALYIFRVFLFPNVKKLNIPSPN